MYRNRRTFSTRGAVRQYRDASGLTPAEIACLAGCRLDGAILDLGVGAGRTTAALAGSAHRYVGVDYAPAMVVQCRARFAGLHHASFILGDAADLPMLAASGFDVVFFSYNGIDYVDHAHRLRILAEVRRLLAPGARFVFSTHNRAYAGLCRRPRLGSFRLRSLARNAIEWTNWALHRRSGCDRKEYALVNDSAHRFGLLTYYIERQAQLEQLRGAGFDVLGAFTPAGAPADCSTDATAADIHFLARASAPH